VNDSSDARWLRLILPLCGVVVGVLVWELTVSAGLIRSVFLPPPSAVVSALFKNIEFLSLSAIVTLRDVAVGYFIGTLVGVTLGIVIGHYRWVNFTVSPLLLLLSPIPIVTFVPLFIIWFGLNLLPVFCCASIASLFPTMMSTISGIKNVDQQLLEVARNFGATNKQTLWMIALPAAMPQISNGLRLSIQLCFLITPVAEMIMGDIGMGGFIWRSADLAKTEVVILGQLTLGVMGLVLYKVFDEIEARYLLRWKRLRQ
jgi:ABC-type nitrate/sulfonate/bicarbonate transport system permease component